MRRTVHRGIEDFPLEVSSDRGVSSWSKMADVEVLDALFAENTPHVQELDLVDLTNFSHDLDVL